MLSDEEVCTEIRAKESGNVRFYFAFQDTTNNNCMIKFKIDFKWSPRFRKYI